MIIFLAGVHGVGKTYLGSPAAASLKLPYATASSLIRAELGAANWNEQKRVQDSYRNQEALISAVSKMRKSDRRLVLDGHFVLRDAVGKLAPLSVDVFRCLGIKGAILLEAPADVVFRRLAERAAPQSLESIEELALAELQHSAQVCRELEIPLVQLHAPDEHQLRSAIQALMA